jgi:signal transduction histidine kinase
VTTEHLQEDPTRVLVHDLRNLVAVIVQYCELIPDETGDADAVKADIQEIRNAAERALVLIEKIPRPAKQPS